MKKRYLYMCMLLIAFCVMSNLVKAQDMGTEDSDNGTGYVVLPDGTILNNQGSQGNGGAYVYNPDGSFVWVPGAIVVQGTATPPTASSSTWALNTDGSGIVKNDDNTFTVVFPGNVGSITTNTSGTYDVNTDIGSCDGCTEQQAILDIPINMPNPTLPPNPTQPEIPSFTQTMQLYGAAMNAYYAPCPTGQYKDSCGHCIPNGQASTCTKDCAGQWGGKAHKDSCGQCVGGSSVILPCKKDCAGAWGGSAGSDGCHACAGGTSGIARCDTAKPVKIICDSTGNAVGQKLTTVMNAVQNTPNMKSISDSVATRMNEAGIAITNDAANIYNVTDYNAGGTARNGTVISYDPAHTIIAGLHNHPPGSDDTPSPGDLYHLLHGFLSNSKYLTDYVLPSDFSAFAISITDTAAARYFNTNYPQNEVIDDPPVNNWSTTYTRFMPRTTYYQAYMNILYDLYMNQHYPIAMIASYANVEILSSMKTGVRMYVRQSGAFKQLSVVISYDAAGPHYKIQICQ